MLLAVLITLCRGVSSDVVEKSPEIWWSHHSSDVRRTVNNAIDAKALHLVL